MLPRQGRSQLRWFRQVRQQAWLRPAQGFCRDQGATSSRAGSASSSTRSPPGPMGAANSRAGSPSSNTRPPRGPMEQPARGRAWLRPAQGRRGDQRSSQLKGRLGFVQHKVPAVTGDQREQPPRGQRRAAGVSSTVAIDGGSSRGHELHGAQLQLCQQQGS